jgi:hypothetical protein
MCTYMSRYTACGPAYRQLMFRWLYDLPRLIRENNTPIKILWLKTDRHTRSAAIRIPFLKKFVLTARSDSRRRYGYKLGAGLEGGCSIVRITVEGGELPR